MRKAHKSKYLLYLTAVLCTVLWGSAIPLIKLGYDLFGIEPHATEDKLLFAGIRFFSAGLILLIPCLIVRKRVTMPGTLCKNALVLGLIQTAGQYFFMYTGLAYITGVNASVFNAFGTLLYIVLAWIIFRDERPSGAKLAGCLIGFSGIMFNCLAAQEMGSLSFLGDGFIIIANVCVAIGFLYSKHSVKSSDPFLLTGMQMGIGGLVLLVIALLLGGRLPTLTASGIVLLLYLILVSSVAFSLWTFLFRTLPPALLGMFNFLTPVFGTLFSYVLSRMGLLNESSAFTVYTVIAIVCSVAGIFLSSLDSFKKSERSRPDKNE